MSGRLASLLSAVDARSLPLRAALDGSFEKDLVENNAPRRQRVRSRWAGRRLDAYVFDPGAMPEDATETSGFDAVEHAEAAQRFDGVEAERVRGYRVAGKLVAIDQQHLPALVGKPGRDCGTRDASANDQCVVFGRGHWWRAHGI